MFECFVRITRKDAQKNPRRCPIWMFFWSHESWGKPIGIVWYFIYLLKLRKRRNKHIYMIMNLIVVNSGNIRIKCDWISLLLLSINYHHILHIRIIYQILYNWFYRWGHFFTRSHRMNIFTWKLEPIYRNTKYIP